MLKPLNVWSMSDEEIGREMSNFAHTPFVLDGLEFGSVEAFYVWLLLSTTATERKAGGGEDWLSLEGTLERG
jgi:predicted NAD-dependent protein-ADP-ribosyltransferase YbiA (DUF1768 family)